ncbi:MAG: right-handed parallel beta-helix repeat-containing protein [Bacteroidales bacterium]|nr:right-handed parallel beta-helix repeat-containing protein [Bacteroidales bacterium]
MRLKLISVLILVNAFYGYSAKYYVSCSGNNLLDGKTPLTAWETIDKVNASMASFVPGDSILFKAGCEFRGQIDVTVSGNSSLPLYFGMYETGAKPVIKGSKLIETWTVHAGNIWKATCSTCPDVINNFFIDGKFQQLGRYPNKGYRTITSANGQISFTDNALTAANNYWNGAEAVMRLWRWYLDRKIVQTQTGTTFTLATTAGSNIQADYGYFLQNHINALDLQGEWCYQKSNKTFYLYYSSDPNPHVIEAAYYTNGIYIDNQSYINIENLHFTHQLEAAVNIEQCDHINFRNNIITYAGIDGIVLRESDYITADNNEVLNTNNDGIVLRRNTNSTIINNLIKSTALNAGRGAANEGSSYMGISFQWEGNLHNNNLIQYNRIDSTGYIGICFGGINTKIRNNYVTYSALTIDDAGGIYCWSDSLGGNEVTGNIVLYTIGNGYGTPDSLSTAAEGIYIDDRSKGILIKDNTAAYCDHGFYIHNSKEVVMRGNTSFNNKGAQLLIKQQDPVIPANPVRNTIVKNNIFCAGDAGQWIMEMRAYNNDIDLFGVFDSNYLYNPYDTLLIYRVYVPGYPSNTTAKEDIFSFADWNKKSQDINSHKFPVLWEKEIVTDTVGNNFILNPQMTTDVNNWSHWGSNSNSQITWDNTNKLDGGSMKTEFTVYTPGSQQLVYPSSSFAFDQTSTYLFSFSIIGTKEGSVGVIPRMAQSPWSNLSQPKYFPIYTQRKDYKYLFRANQNFSVSRVDFEKNVSDSICWFDNVNLFSVNTKTENPEDYIFFYYNPQKTNSTVTINETRRNIDWDIVNINQTLLPFSSLLLFKDTTLITGIKPPQKKSDENFFEIFPNPTSGIININTGLKNFRVTLYDISGRELLSLNNYKTINIEQYSAGIYFIKIENEKGVSVKKIEKK